MCDTYSQFLGIYATQRPLADWQLLGVAPGEQDPTVLEEAALQRFDQIRPYVLKYPQEATGLLNEIAQALNTLLADIRQEEARVTTRVKRTTVAVPTPAPEADSVIEPETAPAELAGAESAPTEAPRLRTMARYLERPGKVTMLVLCQGTLDSTGSELSVWQIKLKKMSITDRQRRKLQRLVKRRTARHGLRARVLGQVGGTAPAGTVAALVKKGLAGLKRLWNRQAALC